MRRVLMELRRLRSEKGFSGQYVGNKLGVAASTISRTENYGQGLTRDVLVELLTVYQAPRKLKEGLLRLHETAHEAGLIGEGDLGLNEDAANWIGFEQDATTIRNYQTMLIPGLLQTFPYAQATIRDVHAGLSAEEVMERTNARIMRQALLRRQSPLDFKVVLHEAALRELVGGSEVMRGQLDHLVEVSRLPRIDLRVLPFGRGANPGMTSPFVIMDFEGVPSLVLLENMVADLYLEEKVDVAAYRLCWQGIWALAYEPEESAALIKKIARTLPLAEEGHGSDDLAEEQLQRPEL
jgi:transcriptional regulator with XRE-family HTH domain